jgi:DinB superfamily
MTHAEFVDDFRRTVETAAERLLAFSDEEAGRRTGPDRWSRKEIIGHLIDSACNNQGRFVRAQLHDDMVFPGYDQEAWVQVQRYQDRPWSELVRLWHDYNEHIAWVMAACDEETRSRERITHNLDQLAWQAVNASIPTTLDYFMRDYVGHLKHHLRQALP